MAKLKGITMMCKSPESVKDICGIDHRSIVESVNSIILILDNNGLISYINPFGLGVLGVLEDELIGRSPSGTIVGDGVTDQVFMAKMMTGKEDQDYEGRCTSEIIKKDGTRTLVAWSGKGSFDASGELIRVICVGNDLGSVDKISQGGSRAELELLLGQRTRQLEVADRGLLLARYRLTLMNTISTCVIQEKSVSLTISRVIEKMLGVFTSCGVAYIRHYKDAASLSITQAQAPDSVPDIRHAVIDGRHARSSLEDMVKDFHPYLFSDTTQIFDHRGFADFVNRTGICSGVIAPVHRDNALLGFLFVYSLAPLILDAQDIDLVEEVSDALALAIENRINQNRIVENDMRLREAQRIAGLGDFERNIDTLALTASSTVLEMFDRQPGTTIPFSQFLASINPEDRRLVEKEFDWVISQRSGYNIEYRIMQPSGEERIINEIGQAVMADNENSYRIGGIIQDVTINKKFKDEIELAQKVFDNATEGVMVTDVAGKIEFVNKGFTTITGYSSQEALGRGPGFLKSGRHDAQFFENIWQTLREKGYWSGEIWNRRKTGESYPEQLSITAITDRWGKPARYISVFSDLSDLREREEQLKFQANYDALTGLPNRTLLQDRIQMSIYRVSRKKEGLAVIFVDMDDFKHVNDSLGHAKGDLLLQQFAERLLSAVRSQDTVARYGGDEFVILIPDTNDKNIINTIIERIRRALQDPVVIDNNEFFLRASMGVTIYPRDGDTPDGLIANADMAMYRSKDRGKGRYSFFTEELNRQVTRRVELETDLRHALARNEFTVFLQPKLGAKDNKICGAEALIRWWHPEKGMVSPAEFIPLAEETGLINSIGKWLIDQACIHSKACSKVMNEHFSIAVNISARQAKDGDLVGIVSRALAEHQVSCKCLEVEITESVVMGNVEKAKTVFRALHDMGIKITIDDFGTGFSSLSYLRLFPVATLKIDKSFVDDIPKDRDSNAMVTTIISMARNLNLTTVAEGVEYQEQLEFLKQNHCDQIQGYYFAKPMPVDKFLAYLHKHQ